MRCDEEHGVISPTTARAHETWVDMVSIEGHWSFSMLLRCPDRHLSLLPTCRGLLDERSCHLLVCDGIKLNCGLCSFARIAIPHQDMQVCPGLCHRLKRMRERPNLVLNLFPPKQNVFHRNGHRCASQEVPSGLDEANSTPSRGFAQSLSLCDSFDGQAFRYVEPARGNRPKFFKGQSYNGKRRPRG